MLIANVAGNYRFIAGIAPFSLGAVADPGYEIVHVRFQLLPNLREGLALIERYLTEFGRPIHALCGIELRIPNPLTLQNFYEFNRPYAEKIASWNLLIDGLNPVARSNVALAVDQVSEAVVYGFSYTVPAATKAKTFIVAGAPEMPVTGTERDIIARGDVSPAGLRKKASFVLDAMSTNLRELEVTWSDVTAIEVYSVHDLHPLFESTILPALQGAGRRGICLHYARPPVVELEFEMDVRGVHKELVLSGRV